MVAQPINWAFFPRDKPGTLRTVGGDALCACAGESCSSTSMLNKTGRPYGGCRPQTRPAPPWFNFSSARTLEYTPNPTTGMVDTHIVQRQATFTGLPRGVWPNCSKVRHSEAYLPGEDNSRGTDHPDGSLTASDNTLRLKDGSLIVQVTVCLGDRPLGWNLPPGPGCGLVNNSGSPCMAPTQVIFRSTDEGLIWRYIGTLMNPAEYPESQNPTAMSESALAQLADGSLMAILRFDGDCGCAPPKTAQQRVRARGECGAYRYYHQVFSSDAGHTWSHAKPVNGTGCVKPRMMMLGEPAVPGPLLLTGGRMCVENVTDLFLWLNADGLGGSASSRLPPNDMWRRHSLSYVHNSLWRGDTAYTFDADINNSQVFETQSYTTLIRLGPLEALVAYNRYHHPGDGVPGCYIDGAGGQQHEMCSTAFVMRLSLARKLDDDDARASLTVEGGKGWELTFRESVIAGKYVDCK
jgi:hypothetical protein